MTTLSEYENPRSEDLPLRVVTPREFRRAALDAGWPAKAVREFLKPPIPKLRPLKVGSELLQLKTHE